MPKLRKYSPLDWYGAKTILRYAGLSIDSLPQLQAAALNAETTAHYELAAACWTLAAFSSLSFYGLARCRASAHRCQKLSLHQEPTHANQ